MRQTVFHESEQQLDTLPVFETADTNCPVKSTRDMGMRLANEQNLSYTLKINKTVILLITKEETLSVRELSSNGYNSKCHATSSISVKTCESHEKC